MPGQRQLAFSNPSEILDLDLCDTHHAILSFVKPDSRVTLGLIGLCA
jgi:hypothetical protein